MSQSSNTTPSDSILIPASDPAAGQGAFFTIAQLREAMSPVGYMTPADQINAAAAAAAQATANAAIPASTLGQPLGPVQSDSNNKVPLANLPSTVLGASHYLGTWDASTNTPLIESGTAPSVPSPVGGYYIVSVSGTPTIDGTSVWHAGDWIIWDGSSWDNLNGQVNPVSSVAGLQGAVSTAQLATALAGPAGLSAAGGLLNIAFGTMANTAAAGNDSRIVGAAQSASVYSYLSTVAAISGYTGNSPSLRTAGYYAVGDGGGAFYTQVNTGAPAITDGAGRNWYLQDLNGTEVNILQFGAKPDGVTDMQPAWAAADAYAAANHKGVFIPAPPSGGSWKLITPMVSTARSLRFESPSYYGSGSFPVHFAPAKITDQLAALTITGNGTRAENVTIAGPEGMPSLATLMTSGWIQSTSSFQGTISGSGTTVNIVSGLTGTPNVGDQISGAGMTNGPSTVTAVSGSTLSISPAQPLIANSQTFTTCALPNYSAIKAGTVGIAVSGQAVLRNCSTNYCKIGILVTDSGGHITFDNCTPAGFIGTYILDNSYDFVWSGGGFGGIWAGLAFGTQNLVGANGGVQGTWFRVQFPLQAAYHIYQFQDSTFSGNSLGISGSFYGCSFESCNEAAIQTLPSSINAIRLYTCTQQWGSTALPSTITPTPQRNLFSLGSLIKFETGSNASNSAYAWAASNLAGGAYAQYSLTATVTPRANSLIDLRYMDSNLRINQYYVPGRWMTNYRSMEDAQKGDFFVRRDLHDVGNLMASPHASTGGNALYPNGSWRSGNSSVTITVQPLSSLPELSGYTLPQQLVDELGANPQIVKVVMPTGLTANTALTLYPAAGSPLQIGTQPLVWFKFWTLQTGPVSGNCAYFLQAGSSGATRLYYETTYIPLGSWTAIQGTNQNLASCGDSTGNLASLSIFTSNTAGTISGSYPGTNTGNGTLTNLSLQTGYQAGTYVLTATSATQFSVAQPDGTVIGTATVGSPFGGPQIGFTITNGSTAFAVNDIFNVQVTAASYGNTVYIAGCMVGLGEVAPFNPLPVPMVENGIAIGSSTLASQSFPRVISGAGTPTMKNMPNGTLYLQEDATSPGLWQYINASWIRFASA